MPDARFEYVARLALAQADFLCRRWLPDGRRSGSEWVARNPRRTDRALGSFSINLRTGRWADFATGDAGGDLISLRAYIDGATQGQALRRVAEEMGHDHVAGPCRPAADPVIRLHPHRAPLPEITPTTEIAWALWSASREAAGTLVERYFETRGLPADATGHVRFVPHAHHHHAVTAPAMIAPVASLAGMHAVHVTYLDAGGAKSKLDPPRKMFGPVRGGGVWFGIPRGRVAVAEGIETALAVLVSTGMSTVAALSASNLPNLQLPISAREIVIAADNDEAGMRAAEVARDRWIAEGRDVQIAIPRRPS